MFTGIHFNKLEKAYCLNRDNMSSYHLETKTKATPIKCHLSTMSFKKNELLCNCPSEHITAPQPSRERTQAGHLLPVELLAALHRGTADELLHPGLPLLDAVLLEDGLGVLQGHGGVVVQLLQAAPEHGAPLLQQGANLPLQLLTLADQVGLPCILQKGRRWHVARRTL